MEKHVKIVGWLNMIFGGLALFVPTLVLINNGGFSGLFAAFNEDIYAFVAVAAVSFHLLMAIPCFLAGWFIRKLSDSARTATILVSAVNMLNVPFGTLLGAYSVWVLMLPETEPLFANAPAQNRRKLPRKAKTTKSTTKVTTRAESPVPAPSDLSGK